MEVLLLEALHQMSQFAKFMKDILSHRRKIEHLKTTTLAEGSSALIQSGNPPKLKDPWSFSIPCYIGSYKISKAFCDLGASVSLMPYTLYSKFGLGNIKLTTMTLQLEGHSCRYPLGILEDVLVRVGDFVFTH